MAYYRMGLDEEVGAPCWRSERSSESMKPRVKICCIASIQEAKTAIEFGASAIGLVGRMPSGPGPIPDELIREIALSVPPPVGTFLLTSETSVDGIVEHHGRTLTNTIQIVDSLSDGTYAQLKAALPSTKIVQVIHVLGKQSVDEAMEISEQVDALLLDSGNPNLKIKELGGTGRVHDWSISRAIRDLARCPVFLAGGLRAENVREAINQVQPFGIDVCSGVRTNGRLDGEKLLHFFRNVPEEP
jgi:phosphoribosylanthranilate isomerase